MEKTANAKDMTPGFYRLAYGAFILLSLYFFFISKDFSMGVSNLGIALVFDPFNQAVTWKERPRWQKAWLIVHLLVLFGTFGYMIFS